MKHKNRFLYQRDLSAAAVLLLFYTINTTPAQTTLPAEDIAEKALAATVYLEMQDKNGKTLGIGSGFFVQPNLIVTNYHVIEGAAKGTAKLVGKYIIENILMFLDDRLENVNIEVLKPALEAIDDLQRLRSLLRKAAKTESLEAFIIHLANGSQ
ncbi:serine protease [Candidatus Poribacteria bacterium]|nr:serine protease [Candidatus Poribacteria bacterium]